MNRIFIKLIICFSVLIITSCFKETDLGYPESVFFTRDGGEATITGDFAFSDANIVGNDNISTTDWRDGMTYVEYDWLRIEYPSTEIELAHNELSIYAEPNGTGKKRKLFVRIFSGPSYHEVKVIQQK